MTSGLSINQLTSFVLYILDRSLQQPQVFMNCSFSDSNKINYFCGPQSFINASTKSQPNAKSRVNLVQEFTTSFHRLPQACQKVSTFSFPPTATQLFQILPRSTYYFFWLEWLFLLTCKNCTFKDNPISEIRRI